LWAKPVVVDAEPNCFNMRARVHGVMAAPSALRSMVVHHYGLEVDVAALKAVADRHHLPIIEDAAKAHGATSKHRWGKNVFKDWVCLLWLATRVVYRCK